MRTLRLAHRGEWRYAPENTIRALELALDLRSCDGLEFDVRLSRDGVPVLLHDLTLMRVQGVPDAVVDLDAAALADLGVPPLSDALATIDESRPDAFLDVELKGVDHGPPTAEVLLASRGPAPTTRSCRRSSRRRSRRCGTCSRDGVGGSTPTRCRTRRSARPSTSAAPA